MYRMPMFEDKSFADSLFFPVKYEEQVDNAPDYVDIGGDDQQVGEPLSEWLQHEIDRWVFI